MQKLIRKSGNSVKAGVEIAAEKPVKESGNNKLSPNDDEEIDADDLVHKAGIKQAKKKEEKDMDDLVHQKRKSVKINTSEEQDIDDLMHKGNDYKRDQ